MFLFCQPNSVDVTPHIITIIINIIVLKLLLSVQAAQAWVEVVAPTEMSTYINNFIMARLPYDATAGPPINGQKRKKEKKKRKKKEKKRGGGGEERRK